MTTLKPYSVRYREKDEPFEALPSYSYECFICEKNIRGPYEDGHLHLAGQKVVDVLRHGKTLTVHVRCNRTAERS